MVDLTESFRAVAEKILTPLEDNVLRTEAKNLCEKFEHLQNTASNAAQKSELSDIFVNALYEVAAQAKEQTTARAVGAHIDAVTEMFAVLKKLDPDCIESSGLPGALAEEVRDLTTAAKIGMYPDAASVMRHAAIRLSSLVLLSPKSRTPQKPSL